jgi:Uma2 family endonuclease
MVTRVQRGVDVVFEAPRWSERWVLQDGVSMPVTPEHLKTTTLLREVLEAWIARTGRDASAGADIALRWDEEHPTVGVDPDVYLVEPALPKGARSILTWVEGHAPPRVVAEVVSRDTAKKDYGEGPAKYAASGVRELWIFDPERRGRGMAGAPWVLQVWRRTKAGAFRQMYAGDGPAYSDELGAWLVVTDQGTRLRVADDDAGERLWLTGAEASDARADDERARADAERARADDERARADDERARADALAARLAELERRSV